MNILCAIPCAPPYLCVHPLQVPHSEQQLIKAAIHNMFRPGVTHADKISPIMKARALVVLGCLIFLVLFTLPWTSST